MYEDPNDVFLRNIETDPNAMGTNDLRGTSKRYRHMT